jgi:hypothetical protein
MSQIVRHAARSSKRKQSHTDLKVPPLREYRSAMHIAILTFEGFNELDSLIAFGDSQSRQEARLARIDRQPGPARPLNERPRGGSPDITCGGSKG